jgi:hypothetical protein
VSEVTDALARWRAAERALRESQPGTPRHAKAQAAYVVTRLEYLRAFEEATRAGGVAPGAGLPQDDVQPLEEMIRQLMDPRKASPDEP